MRGSRDKRIYEYGHHLLSTYGIGKDHTTDEWKNLATSLVYQGLVRQTSDGYNILKINDQSKKILKGETKVYVAVKGKAVKKSIERFKLPSRRSRNFTQSTQNIT